MNKKGNWKILSSEIVYQNNWITVTQDNVIDSKDNKGIFGIVRMKSGSSVLPIDTNGNVYLVSEYKYAIESDSIEVISGGNNGNETHEETARRELKEETGIITGRLIYLGFINPFTTIINSPNYMYLALDLDFGKSNPDTTEVLKIHKVHFTQALNWVNDGTITHGASVVLILKAKPIYENLFHSN